MTKLTKRQEQVLNGIMHGATNSEIAKALKLKEPTVKMHLKALFRAKGVTSRLELVAREYKLQIRDANNCIIDAYRILGRIAPGSVIHKKLKEYAHKWGIHDNT